MNIDLHLLPYDSGRRGWRMGAGPERFIESGLDFQLESEGNIVRTNWVELDTTNLSEIPATFMLYDLLSEGVDASVRSQRFPLVLSGNCGAATGAIAGISQWPLGIIWFDAHGDFNTPETTRSGFLDGMGLAIAAGLCWKNLASKIAHFYPVESSHILHVGGSDFDPEEKRLMDENGVLVVGLEEIRSQSVAALLPAALDRLRAGVEDVYVHLDLDVLDPSSARANQFPTTGGLDVEEVEAILGMIRERFQVRAAGIASYDPVYDPDGITLRAGVQFIHALCAAA